MQLIVNTTHWHFKNNSDVMQFKGGTQTEGVREQDAEENICTEKG
jgi:hypothetical protein